MNSKRHIQIAIVFTIAFTVITYAQVIPSDKNYVHEIVPQQEVLIQNIDNVGGLGVPDNERHIQTISYFDGLGRPMQQVGIAQSPGNTDIINHIGYDSFGRQTKDYLPYASGTGFSGNHRADALSATTVFYDTDAYENTSNPFSEKQLEASPLNRILKQAAPGSPWQMGSGHEIKFEYQTNSVGEVFLFEVDFIDGDTTRPLLVKNANAYGEAQLYKSITKDENWTSGKNHTTEEFKNKLGQVVLKRTYANINAVSIAHDTHYVYDDYGNLTYVIPPKVDATDGISTDELENLCYQYTYDYRNRLISKKIPGKASEHIVYDNLDRPVMTKDALNNWLFTKYDVFGRVIYTGKYTGTETPEALRAIFKAKTATDNYEEKVSTGTGYNNSYYGNSNFPNISIEILTLNYYDNYNFDKAGLELPITSLNEPIISGSQIRSLATGSKIRVLGADETSAWITTLTGYDKKRRAIYIASKNAYLGTIDIMQTELDFVGKVLQTATTHSKDGNTAIQTTDVFVYDHVGRLLTQKQTINSGIEEVIVENNYDALGQLESKGIGGKANQSRLQTVDYTYNIRGWLTGINDIANTNKLFNFKLDYNTGSGVHLYNGNISATSWRTANTDSRLKSYTYSYDALNRITAATGANSFSNYDVSGISYDKMGNIMTLNRLGLLSDDPTSTNFGVMDNLSYSYDSGNRLMKVTDAAILDKYGFKDDAVNTAADTTDDYVYDANGNMITDTNKGITAITYNYLNLPTQVTIANTEHNGNIQYVYDATGVKQRKIVSDGTTQDYAGNYIYKNNVLEFFNHPEGYVNNNNGTFEYVYQYKDHLGNVRLSYQDADNNGVIDAATEIIDEKNYYPFGLTHKGYNNIQSPLGNGVAKKFGFGGKEYGEELGLDWYDVTARNYDPALGRWMNIDPLADQMRRHSPYNYAFDNPLRFIDPDGMSPDDVIIKGDKTFRNRAFANLQALTDDTLQIDKNGKVTIADTNCNGGCAEGDDLVSNLINANETVTIVESKEGNETLAYNVEGAETTNEGDSTIKFNPSLTEGGVDVDGNTERPSEIGLAHELGHSTDIAAGTEPTGGSDYVTPFEDLGVKNQFESNSNIYNSFQRLTNKEVKVRKTVENSVRKRRGLKSRKLVKVKNFKYDRKY